MTPITGRACPAGWLIATDLDHTLIDHPRDAGRAGLVVRSLEAEGFPVIPASSKTFTEMLRFLDEAELPPRPFLFENGCGIGWPLGLAPPPGGMTPAAEHGGFGAYLPMAAARAARDAVRQIRQARDLACVLMDDMAPGELAALTGLDPAAAVLAGQRLASAPVLWRDSLDDLASFQVDLANLGLAAISGGKFVHVSPPWDKARGLARLREWLGQDARMARLLACGDSENDRTLLESADRALLFPLPGGGWMPWHLPARRVPKAGPEAWQEAVRNTLRERAMVAEAAAP